MKNLKVYATLITAAVFSSFLFAGTSYIRVSNQSPYPFTAWGTLSTNSFEYKLSATSSIIKPGSSGYVGVCTKPFLDVNVASPTLSSQANVVVSFRKFLNNGQPNPIISSYVRANLGIDWNAKPAGFGGFYYSVKFDGIKYMQAYNSDSSVQLLVGPSSTLSSASDYSVINSKTGWVIIK